MIDVVVVRGAGDNVGETITDVLMCSLAAALKRGQQLMDQHTTVERVTEHTTFRKGLKTGQIVGVLDALQGEAWVGVLVGFSHIAEGPTVTTELTIERPV